MKQAECGRCAFLDVLEEAAVRGTPIAVQLASGESFIDRVTDVVTERGADDVARDYAVFAAHARVAVAEIAAATRAS